MSVFKYIFSFILIANTVSCKYFKFKKPIDKGRIVASVGDVNLYMSDIKHLYTPKTTSSDSLIKTNMFIENWAKKQILTQKAKLNLSEEKQDELNRIVDNYKDNLFIKSYKEALVLQNIDTLVSEKSLIDFYKANKYIFKLKENIVRVKHYKFKTKSKSRSKRKRLKEIAKIRSDFYKYSIKELDSIYQDDLDFTKMQLSDSIWYSETELKQLRPIFTKALYKNNLKKGFYKELKEADDLHFIKVLELIKRGKVAPIERVAPIIKQMLLHKNKLEFINQLDNKLIKEAIKSNTYKRY